MNRVVTFGELLLSLGSKGNHRLVQAEEFTVRYTGAEANVAVSLAHLGDRGVRGLESSRP